MSLACFIARARNGAFESEGRELSTYRPAGLFLGREEGGNHSTLRGFVECAPHIPTILARAVERPCLCSNDPVCADHDPSALAEERSLHGAACHACLLVPETSCEARNQFLDRALLVETLAQLGAGLL